MSDGAPHDFWIRASARCFKCKYICVTNFFSQGEVHFQAWWRLLSCQFPSYFFLIIRCFVLALVLSLYFTLFVFELLYRIGFTWFIWLFLPCWFSISSWSLVECYHTCLVPGLAFPNALLCSPCSFRRISQLFNMYGWINTYGWSWLVAVCLCSDPYSGKDSWIRPNKAHAKNPYLHPASNHKI